MLCCCICQSSCQPYWQDRKRDYWRCKHCGCVQVPEQFRLSDSAEKAEYDKHENAPQDAGYLRFLNRAAQPLIDRLSAPAHGLDFGCGPGPALQVLLEGAGHKVELYDKYYRADEEVWLHSYDFITLTEVAEHLADPRSVLDLLWHHIRPGGWLLIMTKRVRDLEAFKTWHYKNDPTHITFFHWSTFEHLAGCWQTCAESVADDVVMFRKPAQ